MRKRRRRFRVWIILIITLWGAMILSQQWEKHQASENSIIFDMSGDGMEEERAGSDAFEQDRLFSLRLAVDAGGLVLMVLGISVLITAIADSRRRH